jgi:hypothetical protein
MAATWQRLHPWRAGFERIHFDGSRARPQHRLGFWPHATGVPVDSHAGPFHAAGPHWTAWIRAALRLMEARNAAFATGHRLVDRAASWSLDDPRLVFAREADELVADLCVIGAWEEGAFRWAWADGTIPPQARHALDRVREFGDLSGLEPLVAPTWPAARNEALQLAAVAARVVNAEAVWVSSHQGTTHFFALSNCRRVPRGAAH